MRLPDAAAYEIERREVSRWRHLDLGTWRLEIRAELRRLRCPTHGVRVEGIPFARHGSFHRRLRRPGGLVGHQDRQDDHHPAGAHRLGDRGRICSRVVADELDPTRLEGLFEIGVDEVSWRKHH